MQGVLVEPNPNTFQRLVVNRPTSVQARNFSLHKSIAEHLDVARIHGRCQNNVAEFAAQVNAAICNTTSMVHYISSEAPNDEDPVSTAVNGIREFMSDRFKSEFAHVLDKVRTGI